jgi:putative FmdB family regulatory protein
MPQYDYKCEDGHKYTENRSISEEQKQTTCPECGKNLVRVYAGSSPAIQFKSGGFYSTGG